METPWLEPNTFAILFLGIAIPILGLLGLLTRPTPRRRLCVGIAAVFLALLAGGLALAGEPQGFCMPPALLALLGSLSLGVRHQRLGRTVGGMLSVLRRPELHAAVLVAAGPALAFGWIQWLDPVVPAWVPPAEFELVHEPVRLSKEASLQLRTDAGRLLPLFHPADAPTATERLLEMDAKVVAAREPMGRVIRTGPPTEDYNCHGWVFADGQGWIQGAEVDDILRDNGYYPVADPRPGDVAIYRNIEGGVTHSAVVQTAPYGGPVRIESKWGKGGRFVTSSDGTPYGSAMTYYRSPRRGNRLHGLSDEHSDGPTAVGAAVQVN